jgi:starch-binding outer membrane protein, SusD/RagB family
MKYIKIFTLALATTLLASCEDFLETDSPSSFTQEYIFSNEADAAKAVNGIYALFNTDAFTSRLSSNFMGNTDIEVGGVGASPDNSRRDIWSFETTPGNSDLLTVWNNGYNAINRANECIEGIESSPLYKNQDNKMMKQLLGEALALRAIWYYYLMNHWGDVPLKTTPTKAGDEFYLPKTDRNEILAHLIEDLVKIEPEMMWASQLDYGVERINREFVMGFIARMALMRGGYALYPDLTMKRSNDYLDYYKIANTYAKKLVNSNTHSLNPSYAQVFLNQNQAVVPKGDDVLYEVAFHPGFGDVAWNNGIRVDAGSHPYGSGSNYLSHPASYYHSFDTLDARLPVTCSLVYYDKDLLHQPAGPTSIAPGKWNRLLLKTPPGAASAKGTGINWPLMRYSDVLLMLAETENEIAGPTAEAKEAFRLVRQRAFPPSAQATKVDAYLNAVAGSKERFFNAIVDERAWEFGAEGIRKYDLIRWNLYGKKVAEARNALTQMGNDAVSGTGTYAHLPNYMYYKRKADGTITFLNKHHQVPVAPPLVDSPAKGDNPQGYYRVSWTLALNNPTTLGPADYIVRTWRGYPDNAGLSPVRYILPIHSSIISSSMDILKNDGYGF